MTSPRVTILGAGRMGQGLALALTRAGAGARLVSRRIHPVVPPLSLFQGPRVEAIRGADLVLLAVPDDGIPGLARELAAEVGNAPGLVVLHLSGLLDRKALDGPRVYPPRMHSTMIGERIVP